MSGPACAYARTVTLSPFLAYFFGRQVVNCQHFHISDLHEIVRSSVRSSEGQTCAIFETVDGHFSLK